MTALEINERPPLLSSSRAWLVEDELHYRDTLGRLFARIDGLDHDGTFANAETALEAAAEVRHGRRPAPDLVLMDVNLPGLDGVAATSRLATLLPGVRVVMLTVRDDSETIFAALQAGASGYLLKDAPIGTILDALQEALRGAMLVPAPVARKVLGFFQGVPSADYGLTEREREVIRRMAEGLTQKEIAADLFVSGSTVNGHVQRVYEKLHVHTAPAAVAKALRERLL